MRKLFTIIALSASLLCSAQFYNNEWVGSNGDGNKSSELLAPESLTFKFNTIYGKTLALTEVLDSMTLGRHFNGAELAIEFPSWGGYAWQHYWNHPTIGAAVGCIYMGNRQLMGYAVTAYPYILVPCVRTEHFEMNVKLGAGLAFMTKTWSRTDTTHSYSHPYNFNNAISSIVNIYLNGSLNFNIPIVDGFAINADIGYFHISNGCTMQPNAGYNNIHAQLGASYTWERPYRPSQGNAPTRFSDFPYDISLDFTAAGGYRENFLYDPHGYGVGTLQIGTAYTLTNWYALGLDADLFYNDTFRKYTDEVKYSYRYYLTGNEPARAFRAGLSLDNAFRLGRLSIHFKWGVYFYDPVRNCYKEQNLDYGKHQNVAFYRYNIEKEDGWNYFQLGLRCRIYDNLYAQVMCKTHLHRAEMLTFGLGYSIKWRENRNPGRNPLYEPRFNIYHPGDEIRRPQEYNGDQWGVSRPKSKQPKRKRHFKVQ